MAELTALQSPSEPLSNIKAGKKSCKSDGDKSVGTSPLCPLVYVRYKDHVIYKNIIQPAAKALERETVGWLTHQNQDILLIESDRTARKDSSSGKVNGIIVIKSCILELLPLQKSLNWNLNCKVAIQDSEFAFRQSERKTHGAKDSKGENKT